jgi:hypothetical protein
MPRLRLGLTGRASGILSLGPGIERVIASLSSLLAVVVVAGGIKSDGGGGRMADPASVGGPELLNPKSGGGGMTPGFAPETFGRKSEGGGMFKEVNFDCSAI